MKKEKEELTTVRLFKDAGKYKNDVVVIVNGKAWQIKRGVNVQIPISVAEVLEHSMAQDEATAMMITAEEEKFLANEERLTE